MYDDNVTPTGIASTTFMALLTVTQTEEVLRVVQIVLTCIVALVTLAYTVWKWYRKAKEDGKITADEVDELVDDVKEIIDDTTDKLEDRDNGNKD